jgi:hypothetical protein
VYAGSSFHDFLLVRFDGLLVRLRVCPLRESTLFTRLVVSGPVTRPLPVVNTPAQRPFRSMSAK